jgi:hypothetical protein
LPVLIFKMQQFPKQVDNVVRLVQSPRLNQFESVKLFMETIRFVKTGPWPDMATARLFLASLAGLQPAAQAEFPGANSAAVGRWLVTQGLGPLAFDYCRKTYPELAGYLAHDNYTAVAQSSLNADSLSRIEAAFAAAGLPLVLLKGAALAQTVYGDIAFRTMSDMDIWVREKDMPRAAAVMKQLGYLMHGGRTDRSLALQMLSQGEIQFYGRHWGMVELHWSPFPGWWLARTAAVDEAAIWDRLEPFEAGGAACQLAAEDMVIQVAVHLAVNSQFSIAAVRGLLDIALTAKSRPVDWAVVAQRACAWRVGTAVWQTLLLLEQLIGTPGLGEVRQRLRPSRLRRRLLRKLVSAESILRGNDLRNGRSRYLLLLLLVDRPQDMVHLAWRTLWPEPEWLDARYQGQGSRWSHLWQVVRYGRV